MGSSCCRCGNVWGGSWKPGDQLVNARVGVCKQCPKFSEEKARGSKKKSRCSACSCDPVVLAAKSDGSCPLRKW